jgi:hypothetical protein
LSREVLMVIMSTVGSAGAYESILGPSTDAKLCHHRGL